MSLVAHFTVARPALTTRFDLEALPGDVVGLIGPNGAGKTTILRVLAGLLPVTTGDISLNGRVLASAAGVHVPAHERRTGFVFQDLLLFPHLSALDNVAFGPRSRGAARRDARTSALEWLTRLGVDHLADRLPRQLSGGQAQRVAIARALASDPALLLLDEPTAALDATGAMSLRTQLREHLDGFPGVTVLVTHTALDAMVLADRLVVVDAGTVVQTGTPAEVAAHPRTSHVAALVGLNLVSGRARGGIITTGDNAALVVSSRVSGDVFAAFAPAAVSLFDSRPGGSPRNAWPGEVVSLAPHGDAVRVQIRSVIPLIADVTPSSIAGLDLRPGAPVWASVKATEIAVYPA